MKDHEIAAVLAATLEDARLSRSEKRALKALLADHPSTAQVRHRVRAHAFAMAQAEAADGRADVAFKWLEDVVRACWPDADGDAAAGRPAEVFFSPDGDVASKVASALKRARRRVDVCVFTITDNRVSSAIEDAHRRGVRVRIQTDDDKSLDRGSDIRRLADAGVPVRFDRSPVHMHHKFAIFDGARLLNGSYNWTRSANDHNFENVVFTSDPALVRAFQAEFDRLWERAGASG